MHYLSIGLQMAIVVVAVALLGNWLDGALGFDAPYFALSIPVFTIIALLVKLTNRFNQKK